MLHPEAILQKVARYISQHDMIGNDLRVLVALSGGADSVALLHILRALHYPLEAAHCNFHLRGEESDRDEQFVTDLCRQLDIPCHIKHFDTRDYAATHQKSIETAARDLRYEWFESLLKETGCACVAVAHHIEDQAETILLNVIRGTGLRGLTGMHPVRGNIIRPLLCLHKQEILNYLAHYDLNFVTDSTNMERDALRNRIRLDVIPALQAINPQVATAISRMGENLYPLLKMFAANVRSLFDKFRITPDLFPLDAITPSTLTPLLLHEWLRGKGFNRTQEEEMLAASNEPGCFWQSSKPCIVERVKSGFRLITDACPPAQPEIIQEIVPAMAPTYEPKYAYFDADELIYPLSLRLARPTDEMVPFGKKKAVSINKILKKAGIGVHERPSHWVLCHGDEVLWLVNVRASNLHRVTKRTVNILRVEVKN